MLSRKPLPELNRISLEQALSAFRGSIRQRPPQVSAVHVSGERAHARARRGEVMDLPARTVTLHRLELLNWDPAQAQLEVEVHCTAGTYIRSLARDLGEALGCGGALAQLRRIQALGFSADQAVRIYMAMIQLVVGAASLRATLYRASEEGGDEALSAVTHSYLQDPSRQRLHVAPVLETIVREEPIDISLPYLLDGFRQQLSAATPSPR